MKGENSVNSSLFVCTRGLALVLLLLLPALYAQEKHSGGSSFIQIQGFAPEAISAQSLQSTYTRLWRLLAPQTQIDRSKLIVRFCSGGLCEEDEYRLPEWGGGGAIGTDLIVVYTDGQFALNLSSAQVTRHELSHIVLSRAYPDLAIPRWFHEGVAMTTAGQVRFGQQISLALAVFGNSLLPLDTIETVNTFSQQKAALAYSQSQVAVGFLIEEYGMDVLPAILTEASRAGNFWKGVDEVLAVNEGEFSRLIQKRISRRYRLIYLFANSYLLWVGIVVLFLIGYVINRIRTGRKRRMMESEEE